MSLLANPKRIEIMKNITEHKGTLYIVERLKSSVNGNPRYSCLLVMDGTESIAFKTGVDSSFGYSITNYRDKEVVVSLGTVRNQTTLNDIKLA